VHLRRLGRWTSRLLLAIGKRQTRPWMAPVAALRARAGVPPGGHPLFEGQFSPFGTLALCSRVIAPPQPDWPPRTQVTGFVFYNRAIPMPPELDAFLAAGPPPIVFTLGSSAVGLPGAFFRESAFAAASLGRRAVLLVGRHPENQPREPLPAGVIAVEAAPHDALFPRAAAVVHPGGIGTTGQALRAGHPMLVVPHAHDQPDNAFRVKALGVARVIAPERYRAARVARELRALAGDPSYAERARSIGARVREEDGAAAACAALETVPARIP